MIVDFFFWTWAILKVFICNSIASVLYSGFLASRHAGSLLPRQGLNLHPLHWKVKS